MNFTQWCNILTDNIIESCNTAVSPPEIVDMILYHLHDHHFVTVSQSRNDDSAIIIVIKYF